MSRPLAVEASLDAEELEELRGWCRAKRRTVDEIYEWLLLKGFAVSRGAAWSWQKKFQAEQMGERFSASGELARSMRAAVEGKDFDAVADAATMQLTQVVFEQATALQAEDKVDSLELRRMAGALNSLVTSKVGLVKLLAAKFDQEMKEVRSQAESAGGEAVLTQEKIDQVRKAVFG